MGQKDNISKVRKLQIRNL